jgi:hypothetical protein
MRFVGSGCNQDKGKNETTLNKPSAIDSATSKLEWMKLNNEWVPLITEIDKLVNSSKKFYLNLLHQKTSWHWADYKDN